MKKVVGRNITENIDGIRTYRENYLVSWRNEIFMITGESEKTLWFTSDNEQDFLADFEFIEDRN